jgi:hypothetical protein
MVVILAPAYVPLVVIAVHVIRGGIDVALRRRGSISGALAASDAWYAVGPALVLALAGHPSPAGRARRSTCSRSPRSLPSTSSRRPCGCAARSG